MNQLQKIILVNSGNVSYREVDLDGNIHFIGTQGTGKSTLLRAILFFYNADSRKLGISKEKKSFADFYFPFVDSYLFYEVRQGERFFTVWLYKKQNRLCFRFVDGAYNKELVLSDKRVCSEAEIIQQYAGEGQKVERPIYNFSEYRDVLYGAKRSMSRYSLLDNKNYQNIPRTLSSIFLNASLDGGFIKKTIINSLSDEEFEINLDTNRHLLENARQGYDDVVTYIRHRRKAEHLITRYNEVLVQEEKQKELAWKVGACYNYAKEQLVRSKDSVKIAKEKCEAQEAKIEHISAEFLKSDRILKDKLSVARTNIKEANRLQKEYSEKGIDQIIKEHKKQSAYEQEKVQYIQELELLTSDLKLVEQQYQNSLQALENDTNQRLNNLDRERGTFRERMQEDRSGVLESNSEIKEDVRLGFEEKLQSLETEKHQFDLNLHGLKAERKAIDNRLFLEEERQVLLSEGQDLQKKALEYSANTKQLVIEKQNLEKQGLQEEKLLLFQHELESKEMHSALSSLQKKITKKQTELAYLSDSLFSFLEENKPGWQQDIGRVVNDELLFRNDLNPQLQTGNSLYGVELQLNELEKPELSKSILEEALQSDLLLLKVKQTQQQERTLQQEKQKNNLKKRIGKEQKRVLEATKQNDLATQQCQVALEQLRLRNNEWKERTLVLKQEALSSVEKEMYEQQQFRKLKIEELAEQKSLLTKRLSELEKLKEAKLRELKKEAKTFDVQWQEQQTKLRLQGEQQKSELAQKRRESLESKGVDTPKVELLEQKCKRIESLLKKIRENNPLIERYHYDCERSINRLLDFQNDRKRLEDDISYKKDRFVERKREQQTISEQLYAEKDRCVEFCKSYQLEIDAYDRFSKDIVFEELSSFIKHHDKQSNSSCMLEIDTLKSLALSLRDNDRKLNEYITQFSGYFRENNKLGIDITLQNQLQYRAFAEGIKQFEQKQLILDYKTEVTRDYSIVLDGIINEVNVLVQKRGVVEKTIDRVNKDFKRSNFVGAVKSIEMRIQDSTNKVFEVLRDIRTFKEEKGMEFGELNLFNQGGSEKNDKEAVLLLEELQKQISQYKSRNLYLEDAFDLEFRIKENDNDTNWVTRLANIGSNGTDVLVKSMIYINLLNIFKTTGERKRHDTVLHCLIDEVGILHDSNVAGLIHFAGDRNIRLINGSPNSHNEQDYKHIYIFRKDKKSNRTGITKLISNEI